jgi:hypothetical protein
MEGIVHERDGQRHRDDWGILWEKQGAFNQIVESPLENAGPDEMREYRFPYHRLDELLSNMVPLLEPADGPAGGLPAKPAGQPCSDESGKPAAGLRGEPTGGLPVKPAGEPRSELLSKPAGEMRVKPLGGHLRKPAGKPLRELFLGCDVSPCVFEMYNRLRGMEQALLDLSLNPQQSFELMGRCADFAVSLAQQAVRRFPLDWLWTGDDVASQTTMLMSPATWRELIKPHLARATKVGKDRGLWVAYHCCGSLPEIIEDLIEIGVDVLNPIQYGCPGMGAEELKRKYGKRLAFMGGVDTQGLLPNGTAGEVAAATRRLIETMSSEGGGFILAASHTVPPETPMENIFAMYAAAGLTKERIMDTAAALRARAGGSGIGALP